MNLESENCLILLNLNSSYDYKGIILAPECYVDVLQESNLPTHIAKYCLNILHKKHQHSLYQNQSSFVVFDKYFSRNSATIQGLKDGITIQLRPRMAAPLI